MAYCPQLCCKRHPPCYTEVCGAVLRCAQVPDACVSRGYVTASQLGQQAQGTVARGTDKLWKVLPQAMTCTADVKLQRSP